MSMSNCVTILSMFMVNMELKTAPLMSWGVNGELNRMEIPFHILYKNIKVENDTKLKLEHVWRFIVVCTMTPKQFVLVSLMKNAKIYQIYNQLVDIIRNELEL